jgi:hypothetical protein
VISIYFHFLSFTKSSLLYISDVCINNPWVIACRFYFNCWKFEHSKYLIFLISSTNISFL